MAINNVSIVDKKNCFGCGACDNICPLDAIEMRYDEEGFLYPIINENCVNCGKCTQVCQAVHPIKLHDTPNSYAVWNKDEQIRRLSSSGGFFSAIAEYVMENKGVVFGAIYSDDYSHVFISSAFELEGIGHMRGSKYVFCEVRDTYKEAKDFLEYGKMVLYTGTPCQIAGLNKYLGKEYKNLITADFICHGANSVTAYESWLKELSNGEKILNVDFRDKSVYKWSTTATVYLESGKVVRQDYKDCFWYKGFLEGVINRENCSNCPYARTERCADFTMGDAWQISKINPSYNDQMGTSLILANSTKAEYILDIIKNRFSLCEKIELEEIRKYNGNLNTPQKMAATREYFFSHLKKDGFHKALWYGRGLRWDVGIVGWWFASNYGSVLTYYVLAKSIQKNGKNIIFIPIPRVDGEKWDADTLEAERFISKHFKIAAKRDINHLKEVNHFCDSFILGSDQMWTESTTKLVGYSFFLDFVDKKKKKIACATSFGASNFLSDVKMQYTARDYLKQFDAVSVREESAVEVCRNAFGIIPEQIIDPIFWEGEEVFDELVDEKQRNQLPNNYLLCYILDPDYEKEQLVRKVAKQKNLEIVSILGMKEYNFTKDYWKVGNIIEKPSVEEFLMCIKYCNYLVTDSHHGTCLGILFQKNYLALGNIKRGIDRFYTIGKMLGTIDRILMQPYNYEYVVNLDEIDYSQINTRVKSEVNRAKKWLERAFNKKTIPAEETVYSLLRRLESLEEKVKRCEEHIKN